jgi:alpha-glucosidase
LPQQPDLNWRNPQVKRAMFDAMRFWMQRGVDGFRVDVAHFLMKDPDLRDNPPAEKGDLYKNFGAYDSIQHLYDKGHPDNHPLYREFRAVLNEFEPISPRMSVGEIHVFDWDEWATYYGNNDELHMPFNFALIGKPWRADIVRDVVSNVERVLSRGQQPNYVFSNHDEHRIATRYNPAIARAVMMTLLTLRGTPTMYYGDELGMLDGEIPPDKEQDPWGKRVPGLGLGRDPERTPMQWDAGPNAGFAPAGAEPWLPVASTYPTLNVAAQLNNPRSMLSLTRALLSLRRASPALHAGSHRTITDGVPGDCFVYVRQAGNERSLIAINFADAERAVQLDLLNGAQVAISTQMDREDNLTGTLVLRPYEGCVVKL